MNIYCQSKPTQKRLKEVEENLKKAQDRICRMFLWAVNNHDGEMIIRIAAAVWFWEDRRRAHFPHNDPERIFLLMAKAMYDRSGKKFTIRKIARLVHIKEAAAGKELPTPADGYSALRRKCRQLGIPLAESRKRSRK